MGDYSQNLFRSWNEEMYRRLQDKLPVTHLARLAALKAKGAAACMYPLRSESVQYRMTHADMPIVYVLAYP